MATAALGSECRTPSTTDFQELDDNCDNIWTTLNGIAGRLFTSKVNGQVLFIPAAGFFGRSTNTSIGTQSHSWSSSYKSSSAASNFYYSRSQIQVASDGQRRYGFTVRPVKVP